MPKPIAVGVENFKDMIEEDCYYIDKTLFIKDIIDNPCPAQLFTRPRRFGKTLNLSMIRYFFEKTNTNSAYLFEGLKIWNAGEKYRAYQGRYPVISLSLKDINFQDFETTYSAYKGYISEEFRRHKNAVFDSGVLDDTETDIYQRISQGTANTDEFGKALRLLTCALHKAYGEKTIILIDEYDVPLHNAYFRGFYDEMIGIIRASFSSALKSNDSLKYGILTGCLRVSKESIFSGLNNLRVNDIFSRNYSEYFGFTEQEVEDMAEYYGVKSRMPDIKEWYNGYIFGETEIYNPWSIINFMYEARLNPDIYAEAHWINTSSNDIIKQLIENSNEATKKDIEALIEGRSVTKPVYSDITYKEIDVNADNIWSFLLYTGYLKPIKITKDTEGSLSALMIIPNIEVKTIYSRNILEWFSTLCKNYSGGTVFNAIINGDAEAFETEMQRLLSACISYFDGYEAFYHGFIAGLLAERPSGYDVKSNRESGNGRYDISICEIVKDSIAVIIEIKTAKKKPELADKCAEAINQIKERGYTAEFIEDGFSDFIFYGAAFYKKSVRVMMQRYSV